MFMTIARIKVFIFVIVASFIAIGMDSAFATEAIWQKLRQGGYTILIRHTTAPGVGDPPSFKLDDCSTQRNLSHRGRLEARRIGARMLASGAVISRVYTSQWCRTKQTAELAFERVNDLKELPALNSFYATPSNRKQQTDETRQIIIDFSGPGNQVMVTHQVNITALTGIFPRQGQAVIVSANGDKLEIIGQLSF